MNNSNQQILGKYAQPVSVSPLEEIDSPLSFKEWYKSHQGITTTQEYKQYNDYLVNWYKSKIKNTDDTRLRIKLNYLTFLKQLQIFLSNEELENWYNKVDINNDKELLLAIPYFAKKLKDISLYYLKLRNTVKESKLTYNQVGTNFGISSRIQKFILSEYSKKNNAPITVPANIWQTLPELSAIRDSITIQINELYDDHTYFDQSPTVPISSYFNLNNAELLTFLQSRNLELTSTDWIYNTGVFALSNDFSDFSEQNQLLLTNLFPQKYLGQNKYTTTTESQSSKKDFYSHSILQGNNFFYWPSFVYASQALNLPRYEPISIQDLNLETTATAGSSIELADTIFVKTALGTKGAWLRNKLYEYTDGVMECVLNASSKTVFKFPYPGYGVSGEDIPWSGFGLKTDARFQYLNDELKQNIENTYWSTSTELSSVTPILINNSTLIHDKAYASKNYNYADKIKIKPTSPEYNQSSYVSPPFESWLYRFDTTDLSIKANGNSVIYWPFENINTEIDFPTYFPQNIGSVCNTVPVSSIDFKYAYGSNQLSSADIIYKLKNYKDTINDALECCWLSASDYLIPEQNLITSQQNSLQIYLSSGSFSSFVWSGPDYTDANDVFKTIKHQPDCKYITSRNVDYLQHALCNCKQVLFSPFGHPGEKYHDYQSMADFIIEDNFSPATIDASQINSSNNNFTWYKTNSNVGWGDGTWITNNTTLGNVFYLRKNKKYFYYRCNVKNLDPILYKLPDYILRYQYPYINNAIWIKAKKNNNGEWINTSEPSKMVINPGDVILYSRASSSTYILSGTQEETIDVLENKGSIWSNANYTTVSDIRPIVVSYPAKISVLGTGSQYPKLFLDEIDEVVLWEIKLPNQSSQTLDHTPVISFVPSQSGLYTMSVTALSSYTTTKTVTGYYINDNVTPGVTSITSTPISVITSGYYIFNNIPAITAIPITTQVASFTSINTPLPGFVLNTKLKGWDYNSSTNDDYAITKNAGAKPFWAKSYSGKTEFTGYGGIDFIGNSLKLVDGHNLISQPEFSDILFESGIQIEYNRVYPSKITWSQPIEMQTTVDENQWCTLEFSSSADSNLSYQLGNLKNQLNINPTTSASDILLENIIENEPVEIYYNALNSFTWFITATPQIPETIYATISGNLSIEALQPYANIFNQFYPTIASFPAFEDLYSVNDVGGYFIPVNLGVSQYTNKNYSVEFNLSGVSSLSGYFSNENSIINGRGLTKEFQDTPYILKSENNTWLKEPPTTKQLAGNINKEVFKNHQKFIPYQSGYDNNPNIKLGLVTPDSLQTPWNGVEDSEWSDSLNYPISYTGELNVSKWTDDQILKKSGFLLENWVTDVFGNQYGLYKDTKNIPSSYRSEVPGEIWVRKNSQIVQPAYKSLSGVFDSYKGMSLANDLTGSCILNYINNLSGSQIKRIDVFFDTLLIETPGVLIFEKINYDYEKDEIFSTADDAKYLSLIVPVSSNLLRETEPLPSLIMEKDDSCNDFILQENEFKILLENCNIIAKAGETWFFPEQKLTTISICSLSSSIIFPELYQLDLNKSKLRKIFPVVSEDVSLIGSLSSLKVSSINKPTLSYNSLKKEYLFVVLCKNEFNQDLIVEFYIKDFSQLKLNNITVYNPKPENVLTEPPFIKHSLKINIQYPESLSFQCSAENTPIKFEPINIPNWLNLNSTGLFTGTPSSEGIYNASFAVYNNYGPIYYSLTINVSPVYFLVTDGYLDLYDQEDGFILLEPEITEEQKIIVKPYI